MHVCQRTQHATGYSNRISCTQICLKYKHQAQHSVTLRDADRTNGADTVAVAASCRPYTIMSGDTCWGLQTSRLLSQNAIVANNPGLNCSALKVSLHLRSMNATCDKAILNAAMGQMVKS